MSVMGEITLIANRNLQIHQYSNTPHINISPRSEARDRVPVLQYGADVPRWGEGQEGKVNITIKLGWTSTGAQGELSRL